MREYRLIKTWRGGSPGPARLISRAEGYAMVRRPGAVPFVVSEKEWDAAPSCDKEGHLL
jgi:hypothetical protein